MTQGLNSRKLLLLLPLAYLVLFLFVPLVRVFWIGILEGDKGFGEVVAHLLAHPLYRQVMFNTLKMSLVVTATTLAIGYPIAFLLTHCSEKWERVILVMLISSMWLSVLIRSYAWTILMQINGPLNALLLWTGIAKEPVALMFSPLAVVIGMTHVLLPYMVLVIWTAMKKRSKRLEQVAYSLGASRTFYLWKVFVPFSRSGVTAGVLLVFLLCMGFYVTPALLGGGKGETMMFSMLIEEQVNAFGNWQTGSALAMILLCVILLPLTLSWASTTMRGIWQELFAGGPIE